MTLVTYDLAHTFSVGAKTVTGNDLGLVV